MFAIAASAGDPPEHLNLSVSAVLAFHQPTLMHAYMCRTIAFMIRWQTRWEARVRLWDVASINRYLRRVGNPIVLL